MKTIMNSGSLLLLLGLAMIPFCAKAQVSVWDGTYTPWTKGTGTASEPYLIENARQLAYLATRVNNGLDANGGHVSNPNLHYKLMVDVNLNGSNTFQWTTIGYYVSNTSFQCFGGHFDGNNHTVSGLYINSTADRVGFLGYTDGAVVENLTLTGDMVSTIGSYAGALIGYATNNVTIKNCNNKKIGVQSKGTSGGIIGYGGGIVTNCYNTGNVSGYDYSGGIKGNGGGTVTNCYNTGSVSSTFTTNNSARNYSYSGGIIGYGNGTVTNCYNTGSVSSTSSFYSNNFSAYTYSNSYSGGIIGYGGGTVTNCYNTGSVTSNSTNKNIGYNASYSNSYSGGIIGYGAGTVTDCYNTGRITSASTNSSSSSDYYHYYHSNSYSGGIMGYVTGWTITNCYNVGNVASSSTSTISNLTSSYLGGIIGNINGTVSVTNCYYLSTCGGNNTYGGLPMTAAIMHTAEFVDMLNNGSCAWMQDVTPYKNGGYPLLSGIIITASTLGADSVTQSHATLKGVIQGENDSILSVGFMYIISGDTVFTYKQCSTIKDTLSFTLSGLLPSKQYVYKVFVRTAGCDTTMGDEKNFTTKAVSVVTNAASNVTQSQATLNGVLTVGDATVQTQGFEYKLTTDTVYQKLSVSGDGNISQNVSGLMPGKQY